MRLLQMCIYIYGVFEMIQHEVMCIPQGTRSEIEKNVLEIFGMDNRPRPDLIQSFSRDVTSSAKKYMIGLYETVQEKAVSQNTTESTMNTTVTGNSTDLLHKADTIISFVNNGLVPRPNASDEDGAMFFDVESNLVIEDTLASEVRIFLNVSKKKLADNVLRVTVYKIIIPKTRYLVLASRIVNATESQWHEFDVLKASISWKEDPSQNNGILVVCETLTNQVKAFKECGLIDLRSDDENRPFLVSFYHSGDEDEILAEQLPEDGDTDYKTQARERRRRNLDHLFPRGSMSGSFRNLKRHNSTCGRHPLYIAFRDLGWNDWIIAPEGYKAAYCGGECKFPLHENMNASNHAIIQTLVHMMMPEKIPEPCCAPVRLEPLKVLYLDRSNNVVMKTYSDMIVNDCGCQ
ncbi:bone morphogenetic protein 7-like [Hydractinia symbiolongicarpus]|uniref:bone morphogenetic protein 7-like n=1 Tax=Hydractinia symbiolongicarpus TaxID=13093 RepID=UPI00255180DA|nr:bone morphogenetic protein 7-like [Hydractinia symbiolongicarpus]